MPDSQTAPRWLHRDLGNVIDMDPIRGARISLGWIRCGADVYRGPIGNGCSLDLTVVNRLRGSKAGVVRSSM